MKLPFKVVLASSSPRRIELLGQLGLSIEVMTPGADETPLRGEKPQALVLRLAKKKAQSVAQGIATGPVRLVIAADTIVVAPNGKHILGKPKDAADAKRMLRLLSGKRHLVYTGYALLERFPTIDRSVMIRARAVRSWVRMRKLSSSDIERYVASGEPMDKAGAYAAQGLGMALVESVQGSHANVVGLPVCQLMQDVEKHFGVGFLQWKEGRQEA